LPELLGSKLAAIQTLPVATQRFVNIVQKDTPVFGAIEDTILHYKLAKAVRVVRQELQIGFETDRLTC
jgi:hypothetical protein